MQAEKDKFALGESTNYLTVQDEAYLALERSLGSLLQKNEIYLDNAIGDQVKTSR